MTTTKEEFDTVYDLVEHLLENETKRNLELTERYKEYRKSGVGGEHDNE